MIAVDTNILVYAHRAESAFHSTATDKLTQLAQGAAAWAIPWPCIHEFLSVITNTRVFDPPTPVSVAIDYVENLLRSPSLVLLGETDTHWVGLKSLLTEGRVVGGRVHDARIAAICIQHGVRELWSADRDFGRFPALTVVNPLIGK